MNDVYVYDRATLIRNEEGIEVVFPNYSYLIDHLVYIDYGPDNAYGDVDVYLTDAGRDEIGNGYNKLNYQYVQYTDWLNCASTRGAFDYGYQENIVDKHENGIVNYYEADEEEFAKYDDLR